MLQRKITMKRNNNNNDPAQMKHNYGYIKTTSHRGTNIAKATLFLISSLFISAGLLDLLGCLDFTTFAGLKQVTTKKSTITTNRFPNQCDVVQNQTQQHIRFSLRNQSRPSTCPSYFRWIHEDLRPWKETGITRGMVEKARRTAHFRIVIVDGKVYVKKYRKSIQTRDVFTLWGIVQLLRWYPGRLPDLEMLFDADDRPTVRSKDFRGQHHPAPPPLFRYCSDDVSLDIVFPDWSFWGWAEVNIKPWAKSLVAIEEGNKMIPWKERVAYAYWKGNPYVTPTRRDLLRCNVSDQEDWNTRLYIQLLRWYPGRLPDLEMLFDADDRPTVRSKDFRGQHHPAPPPLFRYCSDDVSLDIVFPDWSFWGWAEVNIKPWAKSLVAIEEGNKMIPWKERVAYAYWKGNPYVTPTRRDLLRCNVSDQEDWNTRLYIQDWVRESREGFKNSNLENQCTHRYKIYIEGWAWSVSEKYIMACDSMTLYVRPKFYDFYIRGMMPLQHYWPIRDNSKCTSLKYAVHWGNTHLDQAQKIGEEGSRFIREQVKMEYVYDYMFHLMNEYAKLLKFKPEIPWGATEITPENMGCPATGRWRDFMAESMVNFPSEVSPCEMPKPYNPLDLREVLERKANLTRQVEIWEDEYFRNLTNSKKP